MPRVLHIEDDPANRLLVRKLLGAAGMEVVDAADGLEGIRKALSERPDLVLVDLAIPGLDGYEVTLRLRAERALAGVPIVAITAEGNRETSLAVGCDGFLQKPIAARTFASTVAGYLRGERDPQPAEPTGEHLRRQSQRIVGHLEEKLAELERTNQLLTVAERARKEFYRNVSHELATPLTPIVGYVRLLRDHELGPLTPLQEKALRSVDDCVGRLRALVENLLDVTGLETGRLRLARRPYDLVAEAQAAVERARPRAVEAGLELLTELPARPLPAVGDAVRLGRALDQLLDNALKFTPRGGTVGIRAAETGEGKRAVTVADSGPGVPREHAGQVFDPFFQGDGSPTRVHGGTGVGLSIVRGIAEGHGGSVRLEPAPIVVGGVRLAGAAFTLELPEDPPELG